MAKSTASLRVFGDDLLPEEVAMLLGCTPTASYKKGDLVSSMPGRTTRRRHGMWNLQVEDREPEAFDEQVQSLLAQVTQELSVWVELGRRFEVDLFCGFFMDNTNQGFTLSKVTIAALSARGIEPGFDIYAPLSNENEAQK